MALIECKFFSEVLELSTQVTVILPQDTRSQIGMTGRAHGTVHPTLYLLHGYSDDDSIWMRRTSIERYVASRGLAVIMPNVHHSYYTDQAVGSRYWTFLSDELPTIMRSFFPLSAAREDTFVAGLSMGGYGAFKWALRCPKVFAAAASLSGVMDVRLQQGREPRWSATFGSLDRVTRNGDDLFLLAEAIYPKDCPPLFQWCGTEDSLRQENLAFRAHCSALGLPLTYEEGAGDHSWSHWDRMIQRVLEWLPLRDPPAQVL